MSLFLFSYDAFLFGNLQILYWVVFSLLLKRNLRNIAELYGCESTLQVVEEYRRSSGLEFISSVCFKTANISAVLIDDGLKLDKKHDLEWHKSYVPFVGRVLRIESLAEEILDQVRYFINVQFWLRIIL